MYDLYTNRIKLIYNHIKVFIPYMNMVHSINQHTPTLTILNMVKLVNIVGTSFDP